MPINVDLIHNSVGYSEFKNPVLEHNLLELGDNKIDYVVGNSANQPRVKFAKELATGLGAEYVHVNLSNGIDELTADQFLRYVPDGLKDIQSTTTYQALTVITKLCRLLWSTNAELTEAGLEGPLVNSLVLLSDTINIKSDGSQMEKPQDRDEAIDQIGYILDGQPYFVSNIQLAMWGSWVKGMAMNVVRTPVRIDDKLGRDDRTQLKNRWIKLYDSAEYPRTPGAVTQTHPEIFKHLQVAESSFVGGKSVSIYEQAFPIQEYAGWKNIANLPQKEVDIIGTTISGSAVLGYLDALHRLAQITDSNDIAKIPFRLINTAFQMLGISGRALMPHQTELSLANSL